MNHAQVRFLKLIRHCWRLRWSVSWAIIAVIAVCFIVPTMLIGAALDWVEDRCGNVLEAFDTYKRWHNNHDYWIRHSTRVSHRRAERSYDETMTFLKQHKGKFR